MLIPFNHSEPALKTVTPAKVVPVTSHVSPWLSHLAYPLGRYALLPLYFGQIEVVGQEHLPTAGPIILAPTHRSRWDAFMIPYVAGEDITGRQLRFMVSANEMKGPQGWFIRRFGGFPIDTQQPGISSLRHGVELLRRGETLVMFPEGNIFRDNCLHPLKPGLARLALQAESSQPGLGIKVVPININYSHPFQPWRCNVKISLGSPLQVENYSRPSTKQSAQQLTTDLEAAFKNLSPHFTPSTGTIANC